MRGTTGTWNEAVAPHAPPTLLCRVEPPLSDVTESLLLFFPQFPCVTPGQQPGIRSLPNFFSSLLPTRCLINVQAQTLVQMMESTQQSAPVPAIHQCRSIPCNWAGLPFPFCKDIHASELLVFDRTAIFLAPIHRFSPFFSPTPLSGLLFALLPRDKQIRTLPCVPTFQASSLRCSLGYSVLTSTTSILPSDGPNGDISARSLPAQCLAGSESTSRPTLVRFASNPGRVARVRVIDDWGVPSPTLPPATRHGAPCPSRCTPPGPSPSSGLGLCTSVYQGTWEGCDEKGGRPAWGCMQVSAAASTGGKPPF